MHILPNKFVRIDCSTSLLLGFYAQNLQVNYSDESLILPCDACLCQRFIGLYSDHISSLISLKNRNRFQNAFRVLVMYSQQDPCPAHGQQVGFLMTLPKHSLK